MCSEVLFIAVLSVVPICTVLLQYVVFGRVTYLGLQIWPDGPYYVFLMIYFVSFVPLTLGLSLISDTILVIWFCIRRNHIARRRVMLKEIGIFLVHLFESILAGLVYILFCIGPDEAIISGQAVGYVISGQAEAIAFSILLAPLSLFPLCVFVYMKHILRIPPREDRREGNNRYDIQTAGGGLQTVPPSTRVSLPSDMAAHAPNFLSPSTAEPTDVTPLLN